MNKTYSNMNAEYTVEIRLSVNTRNIRLLFPVLNKVIEVYDTDYSSAYTTAHSVGKDK